MSGNIGNITTSIDTHRGTMNARAFPVVQNQALLLQKDPNHSISSNASSNYGSINPNGPNITQGKIPLPGTSNVPMNLPGSGSPPIPFPVMQGGPSQKPPERELTATSIVNPINSNMPGSNPPGLGKFPQMQNIPQIGNPNLNQPHYGGIGNQPMTFNNLPQFPNPGYGPNNLVPMQQVQKNNLLGPQASPFLGNPQPGPQMAPFLGNPQPGPQMAPFPSNPQPGPQVPAIATNPPLGFGPQPTGIPNIPKPFQSGQPITAIPLPGKSGPSPIGFSSNPQPGPQIPVNSINPPLGSGPQFTGIPNIPKPFQSGQPIIGIPLPGQSGPPAPGIQNFPKPGVIMNPHLNSPSVLNNRPAIPGFPIPNPLSPMPGNQFPLPQQSNPIIPSNFPNPNISISSSEASVSFPNNMMSNGNNNGIIKRNIGMSSNNLVQNFNNGNLHALQSNNPSILLSINNAGPGQDFLTIDGPAHIVDPISRVIRSMDMNPTA